MTRMLQRFSTLVRTHAFLLLLSGMSLVAYGGMVWLALARGTLRAGQTPATIALYLLAFVAYLGVLVTAERRPRLSVFWIWGPAILFRLILLLTSPTLSDDVYRYLWDGYLIHQGVSPYAYPVNSPALDALAIPLRALVNHPWMASPYLPAAQSFFAAVTGSLPLRPFSLQLALVVVDLANGYLILRLLQLAQLPARRLLIYLWNPLVVVEVAHGAHIDAWMIFLMLLSLWLTFSVDASAGARPSHARLQSLAAPLVLALATLTKPLPALLIPALFWRWRWRGLLMYTAALLAVMIPVGAGAGWGLGGPLDGVGLFGALRIYGERWAFNSGVYHGLQAFFIARGVSPADRWAKAMLGLMLLVVLIAVWRQARERTAARPLLRLLAAPMMAYVLLTPTLHPWYLLLVLAFAPFLAPATDEARVRWLWVAPWLYLSAAVILSYLTYLDPNDYRELGWVRWAQWLPTLALLVAGGVWARTKLE